MAQGDSAMTLTKAGLINLIHKTNNTYTKAQARAAVEAFIELIKNSLVNGDNVLLTNFGKLSIKDKSARKGRNPQSGESMMLGARRVITFKLSGTLRKIVNGQ